ncbi:MAG: type II toxin-antitoxin system RelE/ParE family toxin [Pseudomonadota bacterium]|nr:type II toxin-antitoxin system RelE/ParE family toxin [Pseudomonadota bacterium]MDP1905736.1 type II toxin-antitoxin system RelE/ParE family toxin [Pseudomonadota bacterium]MDP2351350.1 type II toxin-antitoxin system RelE/ParE family toxin [Pseudomonadota bacterium]
MAQADVKRITGFYAEAASLQVAEKARQAIEGAVRDIAEGVVTHRPDKRGTREYVLDKFPYIIIYRATTSNIRIVRVLHQARGYFN